MSRPKNFWYGIVKKMIMMQGELGDRKMQERLFTVAIAEANEITKLLDNGELRMRAVQEILVDQSKTYEGVALELHYQERTIQQWVMDYVNLVGKRAGF